MCDVRRCLVFEALQNLCRYLLDDTERLDSLARVVRAPSLWAGQSSSAVKFGINMTEG